MPSHLWFATRRSLSRAWRVARSDLLLYTLTMLLGAGLPALQVLLVGRLTQAVGRGEAGTTLAVDVVLVALALGCVDAVRSVQNFYFRVLGDKLTSDARTLHAQALARLAPHQLADPEVFVAAKQAEDSARTAMGLFLSSWMMCVQAVATAAGLVAVLSQYSVLGALVLVASVIPTMVVHAQGARRLSAVEREMALLNRTGQYAADQLGYQRTATELASLGTRGRLATVVGKTLERRSQIFRGHVRANSLGQTWAAAAASLLLGIAVWLVVVGPGSSAAAAVSGVVAILAGSTNLGWFGNASGAIMSYGVQVAQVFTFLDSAPARAVEVPRPRPVRSLECRHVSYAYPGAVTDALHDVDLVARRGEMIGLVGVNGAGKTTLVQSVVGLLEPSGGAVTADGQPLSELSDAERLATFSLLTQEFGRYELTLGEAVRLGSPREDVSDEEVWAALRLAHADETVRALPDGLDTQLGQQWGGVGLSGGQWQRLALARVALKDAPVWLLDEPTSAVDAETEAEIFAELAVSKQDRITLVVTHRAWTLRAMDRIYVLDQGRVVQVGDYATLMSQAGRFREIFALQA